VKTIAVTGAGGQIAYSLLFRLAHGDLYNEEVELRLLDQIDLTGIEMELDDCAFPLLKKVTVCSSAEEAFEGADTVFMIGAKPRGPGMERKDLLQDNGKIFVGQGKALNLASKNVNILVVGNPCNTNCLIAMHHAKNLDRKRFYSMTRLDQNRAQSFLAKKAGVDLNDIQHVTIWGNHSNTQVPDYMHVKGIEGVDQRWLKEEFVPKVQKRGAEVIAARGKSSAASAANGAIDAMWSIVHGDPWFSSGIYSNGNPYGIAEDLVFSFPLKSRDGKCEIISGLQIDSSLREMLDKTQKELLEERDMCRDLLR
jgi:malate dehydrogenase